VSVDSGRKPRRTSDSAASPCISPSHSIVGRTLHEQVARRPHALRRRALRDPNIECDRKATLGGRPKRCTSAAAIMAMSASSSALGSSLTKVSVMNSVCSGSISAFIAAMVRTPGGGR
jgi:hypothetical protein